MSSRLSKRKQNGVTIKDRSSPKNKILPYSETAFVRDTIETSFEYVEDGLGRINSKQSFEDDMPHRIHPGSTLDTGEIKIKDSIFYQDENFASTSYSNLGKIISYTIYYLNKVTQCFCFICN